MCCVLFSDMTGPVWKPFEWKSVEPTMSKDLSPSFDWNMTDYVWNSMLCWHSEEQQEDRDSVCVGCVVALGILVLTLWLACCCYSNLRFKR